MLKKIVFRELHKYLQPYSDHVKFHNTDSKLQDNFLKNKNKIIICSQIGDWYQFDRLIPFLKSAKNNNNFYIFLTASEPPNNLNQYSDVIKFFYIPSFYSWYTKFLEPKPTTKNIKKHFLSTNNRQEFSRLSLFLYFIRNNLLEQSYFSYRGTDHNNSNSTFETWLKQGVEFYLNEFDCSDQEKIDINKVRQMIPYEIDTNVCAKGDWSLDLYDYYNKSFLSIVGETYCGDNSPFFTEKIWKPIAMKQPFILMNSKHSLKFLQDLGFRTFSPIIDETYDTLDLPHRFETIFREIKRISKFTIPQLIKMHQQLEEVLEHNYNHFYYVLPKIYNREIEKVGKEIDIIIKNHIQLLQ